MRELIIIAVIAAVAHPVAGIINAERWAVQEMTARFENAKRDGERIEEELHLHDQRDLLATRSESFGD